MALKILNEICSFGLYTKLHTVWRSSKIFLGELSCSIICGKGFTLSRNISGVLPNPGNLILLMIGKNTFLALRENPRLYFLRPLYFPQGTFFNKMSFADLFGLEKP